MTKENANVTEPKASASVGIHARDILAAKKKEQSFDVTKTLPKSGIEVTYPNFIAHDQSMAVMAQAGVTSSRAKKSREGKRKLVNYAASIFCKFGPNKDRLSPTDIGQLLDKEDTAFLTGPLLGEDDDEDGDIEKKD